MNKSNSKAKLTLVPNPKSKKTAATSQRREAPSESETSPQTIEQLATVEFWKDEIAGLKAGSYTSVTEATEKLIDQVLERLKLKRNGEEDVKEFLRLVFDSNETLQATLKKTLNLK